MSRKFGSSAVLLLGESKFPAEHLYPKKCEYCNKPNVALPTYFTSNIHEAYQHQINSQFFVTQPGILPGTHWLKDERADE